APALEQDLVGGMAVVGHLTSGFGSGAEQAARDDEAHDLVGAFEDPVDAQIAEVALDRIVLDVAVAAMELQRLVADPEAGIGREALGHRAAHRRVRLPGIERRSRAPHHEARRLELRRHIGELELQRLELGELAAELPALADMAERRLEAGAGAAERAGGDVEPAAIESHHRDLEPVPLGAETARDGDAAIGELDHRRRLAVPAELPLLLAKAEAGRVLLDEDAGDA